MGSSKPKVTTLPAHEPRSEQAESINNKLGDLFNNSLDNVSAEDWAKKLRNAESMSNNAVQQQQNLLGQLPAIYNKNNGIVDQILNLANTGNVPSPLLDNMNKSVNLGLQSGMGSMLNSLGSRGVLNSSITSKGINNLAGNAANALAQNYLGAYNATGNTLASALQGSQGNVNALLGGANAYGQLPKQAYENVYASITPAYNYYMDTEKIRKSSDDYNYIAKSGK